jgi:hypothetical protein
MDWLMIGVGAGHGVYGNHTLAVGLRQVPAVHPVESLCNSCMKCVRPKHTNQHMVL